jgi:hypothetical protein
MKGEHMGAFINTFITKKESYMTCQLPLPKGSGLQLPV